MRSHKKIAWLIGVGAAVAGLGFLVWRYGAITLLCLVAWVSGPRWERMGPPDINGKKGMAAVDAFIATNGWEMNSSPLAFAFGFGQSVPLKGLPWKRLANREYPVLTHGGVLYVALEGWHHDVIGVAYNPRTNSFAAGVMGFKPLADHWYVWTFAELDDSIKLTKRYEGQQ
ncbi:MAG TPA: hypothetical protein VFE51_29815 [Verrucomicrobiae bacterium]|nr:hypothetical protein [Verrucomicrobiae bacterium]